MQLTGTRFGTIDFSESDVIALPTGLIGFGSLHRFVVIEHREGSPFRWLQSIEEPGMAFLVTNPWIYEETYHPEVADADAEALALGGQTSYDVWTTVNIPGGDATQMTLNLAAPIVINLENRLGKQVVLEGQAYNIRHRVFREVEGASSRLAA
jgi:flagellar assembly factor FliW